MSVIEQWGYNPEDKVVILHLDDLGVAHSINQAAMNIFNSQITTTGSIIANSNWVPEICSWLRKYPKMDIGAHLTLTSEHCNYRWSPLSNSEYHQDLTDDMGYLWKTLEESIQNVSLEAAEKEMEAQILHLIRNGVALTHLDTHMFSIGHPKFLPLTIKLAVKYNIPMFIPILSKLIFDHMGFGDFYPTYCNQLEILRTFNYPIVDDIKFASLEKVKDKKRVYRQILKSIKPGLTHLLFHPGIYNDELHALTSDSAVGRFQDYEVLIDPEFRRMLEKYEIKVGTYSQMQTYFQKISKDVHWEQLRMKNL